MSKADDILKIARAELGTKESPSGSNRVKYNTWYYGREVSGSAYPWCAAFTSFVLDKCGITDYKSVSCPVIKSTAIKKGTYHKGSSGIKPSDLVLYQFDKDSDPDHIGIVESVSGSSIVAIEGNTSVTSDDNGGCVMRRTRSKGLIMGYVSLVAGAASPSSGWSRENFIRELQARIGAAVDGQPGPETYGKLPEISTTLNNRHPVVSSLQLYLLGLGYKLPAYGPDGQYGEEAKAVVVAYQTAAGLEADGVVGVNTWRALLGA